jgi:L-asparaginase
VGMRREIPGNAASALRNVPADELVAALTHFGVNEGIRWRLVALQDEQGRELAPVDSSEVGPKHWLYLAGMLERHYQDFDGFVILHGTDTLAYTASALSFLLTNLAKPVVLTGSQLPIFELRSDARQNVLHALLIAGAKAVNLPIVAEVTVCFGEKLLRGNRARKVSTTGWQAFDSPNYPPLATLSERVHVHTELLASPPTADAAFYVSKALDDRVLDLTLFPGIRPAHVEALLSQPDLQGIVVRAYGAGNAPEDPQLLDCIGTALQRGKTVLVVTQCTEGRVELGRYASTPEAALTKLMWVLANETGPEVRVQLQLNQRGEQSYGRHEVRFPLQGSVNGESCERWELTARPAGNVNRSRLDRAVLRIDAPPGPGVRVYLNANAREPEESRCLARLAALEAGGHMLEVTETVRRFMADDRPFHLLVLADAPARLDNVELLLTVH